MSRRKPAKLNRKQRLAFPGTLRETDKVYKRGNALRVVRSNGDKWEWSTSDEYWFAIGGILQNNSDGRLLGQ